MIVRAARADDSSRLFAWRNDPTTAVMSGTGSSVAWQDHAAWYQAALEAKSKTIFIGEQNGVAIGMVRFDEASTRNEAEVSINLAPDVRGRGMSRPLLNAAILAYRPFSAVSFRARVRRDNAASRRLFEQCGFVQSGLDGQLLNYVRPVDERTEDGRPIATSQQSKNSGCPVKERHDD